MSLIKIVDPNYFMSDLQSNYGIPSIIKSFIIITISYINVMKTWLL